MRNVQFKRDYRLVLDNTLLLFYEEPSDIPDWEITDMIIRVINAQHGQDVV